MTTMVAYWRGFMGICVIVRPRISGVWVTMWLLWLYFMAHWRIFAFLVSVFLYGPYSRTPPIPRVHQLLLRFPAEQRVRAGMRVCTVHTSIHNTQACFGDYFAVFTCKNWFFPRIFVFLARIFVVFTRICLVLARICVFCGTMACRIEA